MVPPPKLAGRSLTKSRTKKGLFPLGNVNLSKPALRVDVASIWILLFNVKEKYPGDASKQISAKGFFVTVIDSYHLCYSSLASHEPVWWSYRC